MFRGVSEKKIHQFIQETLSEQVVKRRLVSRYLPEASKVCSPYISSALPILSLMSLASGQMETARHFVDSFELLLGDNATDDLAGVAIHKWLTMGNSTKSFLRPAFEHTNEFVETMKLLGYAIYGQLIGDDQAVQWLTEVSESHETNMCSIRQRCLALGSKFMRDELGKEGLPDHEDWLNIAAYCRTTAVDSAEWQDVLAPLLRIHGKNRLVLDPMQNTENEKWVRNSIIKSKVQDKWLGPVCWQEDVPGINTVIFRLCEDVGLEFQAGNLYGSCLRLVYGEHNQDFLGLVTDVNKRLLLCSTHEGKFIGRSFVGLSDAGLHICPTYPACHPTVSYIFETGVSRLCEEIGCNINKSESNLCPNGITASVYETDWILK